MLGDKITYRQLREELDLLNDEQLDQEVVITSNYYDYFYFYLNPYWYVGKTDNTHPVFVPVLTESGGFKRELSLNG